jgi:hypothetical protein
LFFPQVATFVAAAQLFPEFGQLQHVYWSKLLCTLSLPVLSFLQDRTDMSKPSSHI